MSDCPKIISQSSIWKATLENIEKDQFEGERERLRSSFLSFRTRVSLLAAQIAQDLPDLTVHDISHLDSLWEVASQIIGPDFYLTPTEGYVLGGAILLHDLAMSIAATPGGLNTLKGDVRWNDSIVALYRRNESREPTSSEIESPSREIERSVIFEILRQIHAENAEKLAFQQFGIGSESQFLIEDSELRQNFGRSIGLIGHSHWWSLSQIESKFERTIGAPSWAPQTWTIDPLKVACILRAADAAHLDARRAPLFQKVFSNIDIRSKVHWEFQARLSKAYVRNDALVFTSCQAFSIEHSNAWWLCLDTLKMVDSELRGIDSLLSDRNMIRFAAKRVAGVDHPERLAQYIHTSDWHPIHAAVFISDLPSIIRSLGGEELYGNEPTTPLRELIQNSSDAIMARRFCEGRDKGFGEISIELSEQSDIYTLKVKDNGIGMSKRVLTQYLLDFGCSFWNRPQVQEEFPGLLAAGFRSTGKFGIGFFSVFMAADRVKITTRRSDAASADTLILEFGSGLDGRPILKSATKGEQLNDGGTVVELLLRKSPYEKDGLLVRRTHKEEKKILSLLDVCRSLAPTLSVKLTVTEKNLKETAIEASDWEYIPGEELLADRCFSKIDFWDTLDVSPEYISKLASNLRIVKDSKGNPIARMCVSSSGHGPYSFQYASGGVVTVGGLRSSNANGIVGCLVGETVKAARDQAKPLISRDELKKWASEQAELVPLLYEKPEQQSSAAHIIRLCGGNTGRLPIVRHKENWYSYSDIKNLNLPDTLIVIDWYTNTHELKRLDEIVFHENVFSTNVSSYVALFGRQFWEFNTENEVPITLLGAFIEAVAEYWRVSVSEILKLNSLDVREGVEIGIFNEKPVSVRATIIHKPRA